MTTIGQIERITQNRIVKLFKEELGYTYLGNWEERKNNINIEEAILIAYLGTSNYNEVRKAIAICQGNNSAINLSEIDNIEPTKL